MVTLNYHQDVCTNVYMHGVLSNIRIGVCSCMQVDGLVRYSDVLLLCYYDVLCVM